MSEPIDLLWFIEWGDGPKGLEWCKWYKLRPITCRTIRPDEVPEWPKKLELDAKCVFAPIAYLDEINQRAAKGLSQIPQADPDSDMYRAAISCV